MKMMLPTGRSSLTLKAPLLTSKLLSNLGYARLNLQSSKEKQWSNDSKLKYARRRSSQMNLSNYCRMDILRRSMRIKLHFFTRKLSTTKICSRMRRRFNSQIQTIQPRKKSWSKLWKKNSLIQGSQRLNSLWWRKGSKDHSALRLHRLQEALYLSKTAAKRHLNSLRMKWQF